MAWNYNTKGTDDDKATIWDLRQSYIEIVTALMKQLVQARITHNFPLVFDLLDDLHTQVNQKLKLKEKEEYNRRLEQAKQIISKYPEAYLGKNKNAMEFYAVKQALKELEMYLYEIMEARKMFGAKEEAELI